MKEFFKIFEVEKDRTVKYSIFTLSLASGGCGSMVKLFLIAGPLLAFTAAGYIDGTGFERSPGIKPFYEPGIYLHSAGGRS